MAQHAGEDLLAGLLDKRHSLTVCPERPSTMTAPVNIVDCTTQRRIGVAFRRSRPGPEERLVNWLIEALPFQVPPTCRATVFREPRLDSGFPDLVIVVWHPPTMQKWAAARDKLMPADLRLLQYLVNNGPADENDLRAVFSGRQLRAALDRLEEAILVRRFRSGWAARSVQKSFAVRNIIAVEAKIVDWQAAAQQAYLNTWFTPESYVLLPIAAKGHPLRAAARKLGIGVVSKAQGLVRKPRSNGAQPRSYASWLFNEWAWRASRRQSK